MSILVTGGLGYIGSHTVIELFEEGYNDIIIVDNLSNSKIDVLWSLEKIVGKKIKFYEYDLNDEKLTFEIFKTNEINSIIHFAGLKAVGESCQLPLKYYNNNIVSTLNLLKAMKIHNVDNFVFSSSATVYGVPEKLPLDEECRLSVTNPYGRTKLIIEEIISDFSKANKEKKFSILRYFNPVGAHKSGLIGEDPNGIPNNLVPYVSRVAKGEYEYVQVFGDDYETKDGTGVRDYIHVVDLAKGHIKALEYLKKRKGVQIHNLGTGIGYSVLEVISEYSQVVGSAIPFKIVERRPGDIATCYADPDKARVELGWEAKYNLNDMLQDTWNFEKKNT